MAGARRRSRRALPYVPALDGLRAIAVLLVIGYHLGYSGFAGGYIGVEVFFVLSGWLVCALLVGEHRSSGRIDLKDFWLRRARRLLPAVVVIIAATLAVAAAVQPERLAALRSDAVAGLGYHLNWRLILDRQSYFAAAEGPSALQHLWSLSIEEQFYLLFPLALGVLLAARWRRRSTPAVVLLVVLAVAVLSTVLRVLWLEPGVDPSRVYFGTDTRGAGLLFGVALGLFWSPRRMRLPARWWAATWRWSAALDAVALCGLGVLAWYTVGVSEQDGTAFGLPFTAAEAATLALIAVAVFPAPTVTSRALGVKPLVWIGRRSYGIYLIHWPVIVFTSRAPGQQPESLARVAAQLTAILLLSALSYRWIEQPIRRRGFAAVARDVRTAVGRWLAAGRPRVAALATAGLVLLAGAVVVGHRVVTAREPAEPHAASVVIGGAQNDGPGDAPGAGGAPGTPGGTADPAEPGSAEPAPTTAGQDGGRAPAPSGTPAAPAPAPAPAFPPTTAIGDSVMVGGAEALAQRIGPALGLNAEVGRQMSEAPGLIRDLAGRGQLGEDVVIHLGNNGAFTDQQIDAVFDAIGPDRKVVLVTVFVPRRWEGPVNEALAAAARRHPNARLADWRSVVAAEPGLTAGDGYHLSPAGARRYADVIAAAMTS